MWLEARLLRESTTLFVQVDASGLAAVNILIQKKCRQFVGVIVFFFFVIVLGLLKEQRAIRS